MLGMSQDVMTVAKVVGMQEGHSVEVEVEVTVKVIVAMHDVSDGTGLSIMPFEGSGAPIMVAKMAPSCEACSDAATVVPATAALDISAMAKGAPCRWPLVGL